MKTLPNNKVRIIRYRLTEKKVNGSRPSQQPQPNTGNNHLNK